MIDLGPCGDLALELAESIEREDEEGFGPRAKLLDAVIVVEVDKGHGDGRTLVRYRATSDRLVVVRGLLEIAVGLASTHVEDDDEVG